MAKKGTPPTWPIGTRDRYATDWRARALAETKRADEAEAIGLRCVDIAGKEVARCSLAESIARRALVEGLAECELQRRRAEVAEQNYAEALAECERLRSLVDDNYYWQDDTGATWSSKMSDDTSRGRCSGIPDCCVEYYAQGGRSLAGWGYVPCPRCERDGRRVEVKTCDESCTCGQWATRVRLDVEPDLDEQAIRADERRRVVEWHSGRRAEVLTTPASTDLLARGISIGRAAAHDESADAIERGEHDKGRG